MLQKRLPEFLESKIPDFYKIGIEKLVQDEKSVLMLMDVILVNKNISYFKVQSVL